MLPFLMLLCGVSALEPTFRYVTQPRIFRRSEEVCQVCYGNFDCLVISKAECDYKAEADAIFKDDEEEVVINDSIKSDVDTKMYDLMLKESLHLDFTECIPIISAYSDCHRGNICTGCTKCVCNSEGRWSCSKVQQCRRETVLVNHRVLALVMENLKEDNSETPLRYKRSEGTEDKSTKITPEEIAEWMYGGKMTNETREIVSEKPQVLNNLNNTKEAAKETKNSTDVAHKSTEDILKNITFDEMLREIGLDFKINVSVNNTTERNNASLNTKRFLEMLSMEEGKDAIKPSGNDSRVIIDLLNNDVNFAVDTGNFISNDAKDKKDGYGDLNTDMDAMGYSNFVNIMKRDVKHVTSTIKITTSALTTTKAAVSNNSKNLTTLQNLHNKVIDPIDIMIQDKYKEIELLSSLKNSLISFMTACNGTVFNARQDYYNISSLTNNNFRRMLRPDTSGLLDRYTTKLKRDLKEVIKSIMGIKKGSNNRLPKELKLILQAISIYMKTYKNTDKTKRRRNRQHRRIPHYNARRQLEYVDTTVNVDDIKDALISILEVLDRDMPLTNALGPLSRGAKKVLKRVINNNYVDDSAVVGFKINDPNYNIVTELNNVAAVKWQKLTEDVANSPPADRLYNMQLLHFTLYKEIIKLREAYASLKFSHSRRMAKIHEDVGIEILNNIDSNLKTVSQEMLRFVNRAPGSKKIKKKISLLKKIKGLLTKSKKSMLKVLHSEKKNKAAEGRKKLDENYKQRSSYTIGMWQDYPKNPPRSKRSLSEYSKSINKQRNRMKNIIPQYLRGKLNPALTAKGMSLRKKVHFVTVKPKVRNPVHLKQKIITSTAKTKLTKRRLNKSRE